jgi:predicted DNA-binding WGR domain protein
MSDAPSPQSAPTLDVYGLELHKREGTSDKYYRIFVIGAAVVIHFGRSGSVGQVCLHSFSSQSGAVAKARDMGNAKEAAGYRVTRKFTSFDYPADRLGEQIGTAVTGAAPSSRTIRLSGHERHVSDLAAAFRRAAAAAGHVLPGADR